MKSHDPLPTALLKRLFNDLFDLSFLRQLVENQESQRKHIYFVYIIVLNGTSQIYKQTGFLLIDLGLKFKEDSWMLI